MWRRVTAPTCMLLLASLITGCLPDGNRTQREPDTEMGTPIPAPDSSETTDTYPDAGTADTADPTPDPDTGPSTGDTNGTSDASDAGDTGDRPPDTGLGDTDVETPDTAADTATRDTGDPVADTGESRDTASPDTSPPDPTDVGTDTAAPDTGSPPDTGSADTANACTGVTCGTNAHCADGACVCDVGFDGDPTSRCYTPKSCSSRSDCGSFTLCVGGECTCEPGFERKSASACSRPSVGAPANRTKSEVCARWTSKTANLTRNIWSSAPANQCAPGTLKPIVQWEALEYTNVYRWLVGLDPLHADDTYIDKNQQCATCLAAEGKLTHNITSSFTCYTKDAADGASSSNIAVGIGHPAGTIRPYIRDRGVSSLGHRRWIFSPSLGTTGFGHRGNYGCMWTLDGSGTDNQRDMFYPAPGPFPKKAIAGPWSYLSAANLETGNASVTVTDVASGSTVQVSNLNRLTHGTYGRVTGVSWTVPNATTGTQYRVTISGLGSSGSTTKSYKTTLVACP